MPIDAAIEAERHGPRLPGDWTGPTDEWTGRGGGEIVPRATGSFRAMAESFPAAEESCRAAEGSVPSAAWIGACGARIACCGACIVPRVPRILSIRRIDACTGRSDAGRRGTRPSARCMDGTLSTDAWTPRKVRSAGFRQSNPACQAPAVDSAINLVAMPREVVLSVRSR
jgi:hypothetical protein